MLGLSRSAVTLSVFRETYLKPAIYLLWLLVVALGIGWGVGRFAVAGAAGCAVTWLATLVIVVGLMPLLLQPDLREYALPSRVWLDNHHFLVAAATMVLGVICLATLVCPRHAETKETPIYGAGFWVALIALAVGALSGVAMEFHIESFVSPARVSYTLFDVSLVVLLAASIVFLANKLGPIRPAGQTDADGNGTAP